MVVPEGFRGGCFRLFKKNGTKGTVVTTENLESICQKMLCSLSINVFQCTLNEVHLGLSSIIFREHLTLLSFEKALAFFHMTLLSRSKRCVETFKPVRAVLRKLVAAPFANLASIMGKMGDDTTV